MTTTTKVEVSPESAQAALKRAQGLLHVWAPLVRAVARNPKLKVQLTGGAPRTDGETVWLRVPIELAFEDHDKAVCREWDESKNEYQCPACQVELDCDMALFHEVSHLLAGSFGHEDPDAELIALLEAHWPEVKWDRRALSIGEYATPTKANTLIQRLVERFPDQWGFFAFNVVEDVYVNASITSARKGLTLIFESFYEKIMKDGILQDDGSIVRFNELHPFIQACAAWSLIASGQPAVTKHLDADVVAKVKGSEVLMGLVTEINGAHNLVDRFKISMRLLMEMERLEFFSREPDPEPTPGEGEECEDGEPSDGEGDSEGSEGDGGDDSDGDSDGGDPREGEPTGGTTKETDSTDSPTARPDDATSSGSGDGDDDESDSDSGDDDGEGKNEDGIEPDSDSPTDGDDASGDDESEGTDSHGESAEVGSDGDGESGDSEASTSPVPDADSEAAPSDGRADLESTGGGKVDHDAAPTAESAETPVGLPDIEEARHAFEVLTGHEGFGDDKDLDSALGEVEEPTSYEERAATELVESALSFDGVLDHIDGSLVMATISDTARTRYNGTLIGDRGGAYDLPTEIMAPAAQRMRLALAANRKIGNQRGLTSGPRLDAKTLGYRIPTGDDRIFARRSIPKKRDWTVLIGIDASGSTASGALETEKAVAIGIGDLLTQLGIPFSMFAHTGEGASVGGRSGYKLVIAPLKTEHQLWKGDGRDNARRLKSGAANLDGHTMQAYRKMLERQKGRDKLLLYFTDGAMPCENGPEEKRILKQECAVLKAKGIYTIGVGIGCDDPRRYGLDTIEVNSTRDIPALLAGIGDRLTH